MTKISQIKIIDESWLDTIIQMAEEYEKNLLSLPKSVRDKTWDDQIHAQEVKINLLKEMKAQLKPIKAIAAEIFMEGVVNPDKPKERWNLLLDKDFEL